MVSDWPILWPLCIAWISDELGINAADIIYGDGFSISTTTGNCYKWTCKRELLVIAGSGFIDCLSKNL